MNRDPLHPLPPAPYFEAATRIRTACDAVNIAAPDSITLLGENRVQVCWRDRGPIEYANLDAALDEVWRLGAMVGNITPGTVVTCTGGDDTP